jgi:invasion protein IalB
MIRLVVAVLFVALQGLGAAFAGAPADPSSSAPKQTPAEQAAPKAPAKDAAKEAAKAGGERIGDWTLFCPEGKNKTEPPSCTLEQLLIDAETKRVAFHLAIG